MTDDLRTRAERKGAEMTARGFKVIRYEGDLIIGTAGANEILGHGPRYMRNLRNEGRAPRSVQFIVDQSRSAHHFYYIIDLLGMVAIREPGAIYFQKAS